MQKHLLPHDVVPGKFLSHRRGSVRCGGLCYLLNHSRDEPRGSLQVPELTDNGAINVFTMEDAVYVASETNFLRRVDVESLATMEKVGPVAFVCSNSDGGCRKRDAE